MSSENKKNILNLYNVFFFFVSKVSELGDRWERVWEGNQREALTYCTEQAGSHDSQKEKQVSTIAFVALRFFLYLSSFRFLYSWCSAKLYVAKIQI